MRPRRVGEPGGEHQPDRHRLAVRHDGGRSLDLQGVGERVPVVEQRPPAVFTLVGGDDGGLDLHAPGDPGLDVEDRRDRRR